jgi:hypothetical protein
MDPLDSLESSLSESLVAFAIGAVVIGLVLEYGPEFFHSAKKRSFGITSVGAILVVLGVAGELGLHVRSSQIVSKIRVIQRDIDIAQRKTIAEVTERAAKAEQHAAEAGAEVAKANEAAAKANERTAELKLALEKEIAARQPRTITSQQHDRIVEYLKNANPKGPITVLWKLFDEEAEKFGRQVITALKDSGFDATEGRGPMGFGERGAWIVVKDLAKVTSAPTSIGAVQAAFRDILQVTFEGGERKEGYPDVDVTIAIGAKP